MAIVYQHIRLDTNDVFYIGVEFDTDKKPANGKRAVSKHNRSSFWKKITNKTSYNTKILYDNISNQEAIEVEKYLIKYYGRRDLKLGKLVNQTDGGEGTVNIIRTSEFREKLRKANLGKKRSLESIEKTRQFNIGSKRSKETISKIKNYRIGKKHSEETKLKMSEKAKLRNKSLI